MSKKNCFKRFSNFTRYFLVGLFVAVSGATANHTFAYEMWDLVSDFNSCSSCVHEVNFVTNWGSLWLQYYNKNIYGAIWTPYTDWVSLQYMANLRSSRLIWSVPNAWYVSYPLVWFEDNWIWGINFKYFMNWETPYLESFNVLSRAWFEVTFDDWTSCLLNKVYFNAWSIIFKCSDSNKTFQILAWGYSIGKAFLYLDAYNSTNNVWWIDWENWKARAITLEKEDLSKILYGDEYVDSNFLSSLFSTGYQSYSVSAWGSNIYPTCWLYDCWKQSTNSSDVGFTYSRDLTNVAPDFWNSNNNNSSSQVTIPDSVNTAVVAESCMDKTSKVRNYAFYYYLCNESSVSNWQGKASELLFWSDYTYGPNRVLSTSWLNNACVQFVNYHNMIFNEFDWTWGYERYGVFANLSGSTPNGYLVTSNMYNPNEYFFNLAYTWVTQSVYLDENNNVKGLPSETVICNNYTNVINNNNNQSVGDKAVSFWFNMICAVGLGSQEDCAKYTNSWLSGSDSANFFDIVLDWLENVFDNPLTDRFISPLQEKYNEWFSLISPIQCVTTNNSFAYWNILLYFGVAIIGMILVSIFL